MNSTTNERPLGGSNSQSFATAASVIAPQHSTQPTATVPAHPILLTLLQKPNKRLLKVLRRLMNSHPALTYSSFCDLPMTDALDLYSLFEAKDFFLYQATITGSSEHKLFYAYVSTIFDCLDAAQLQRLCHLNSRSEALRRFIADHFDRRVHHCLNLGYSPTLHRFVDYDCGICSSYQFSAIFPHPLPILVPEFTAQSDTIRKNGERSRRLQQHLHQTLCTTSGHAHSFANCHFNSSAKHVKRCYACHPSLPSNASRYEEFTAQGLFDMTHNVGTDSMDRLSNIVETLTDTISSATGDVNSTVNLARDDIRQIIEVMKDLKTSLSDGIQINHTFGSSTSAPDVSTDDSRTDFFKGQLTLLPSYASILVTLLSDSSLLTKSILLIPPLQHIAPAILAKVNLASLLESFWNGNADETDSFAAQCPIDISGTFFAAARTFVALISRLYNITFTFKDLDTFLRRCDLIPKAAKGLTQITTWIVSVFTSLINWFAYKLGFETPFRSSYETMIEPWIHNADELLTTRPSSENFNSAHVRRLFDAYESGLKLQETLSRMRSPMDVLRLVGERLASLKTVTHSLSHLAYLSGPRVEPIFLYLWGRSGVGKTGASNTILIDMAKVDPDVNPSEWTKNVYMRFPEQEYHDGATNDNRFELYDDFGQIRDSRTTPDPSLLEVIRLGNIIPYPRHMADVSDKGKIYAQPRLVVLTSNVEKPDIQSLVCPEAFERRIDMRFEIQNDPSVVCKPGPQGNMLPCTLSEYNRYRLRNDPDAEPLDTSVYRFVGQCRGTQYDLTYKQFISLLAAEYTANLGRTYDMREFYDRYASKPLDLDDTFVAQAPIYLRQKDLFTEASLQQILSSCTIPSDRLFDFVTSFQKCIASNGASADEKYIAETIAHLHTIWPADCPFEAPRPLRIFFKSTECISDSFQVRFRRAALAVYRRLESGTLPDRTPFKELAAIYNVSILNIKEQGLLAKIARIAYLSGPLTSLGILTQLHDALDTDTLQQIEDLEEFEAYTELVRPSPSDFEEYFIAARSIFTLNSSSIEAALRKAKFPQAKIRSLGRIWRGTDATQATAQTNAWFAELTLTEQALFFKTTCAFQSDVSAIDKVFCDLHPLTSWEKFKRNASLGGWNLFNRLWVTHPVVALCLGITLILASSSMVSLVASYLFDVVANSLIPSIRNWLSPPALNLAESGLYSGKAAQRRTPVAESALYGNRGPALLRPRGPTAESPTFNAQGIVDTNAHQLINSRIISNLRTLSLVQNGQVALPINGFIVRGRCMISYAHHLDVFLANCGPTDIIRVTDAAGTICGNILPSDLQILKVDSLDGEPEDLCVFVLPRFLPAGKDLSKHFVPANLLSKVDRGEIVTVTPAYRSTAGSHIAYRHSTAKIIKRATYNLERPGQPSRAIELASMIESRADTTIGDCGSIVVSLSPSLAQKICGLHVAGSSNGYARAVPLTSEKIERILSSVPFDAQGFSTPCVEDDPSVSSIAQAPLGNFIIPGNFAREADLLKPSAIGTNSSLYRSPISGVLAESQVKPAYLRPQTRDGELINPMVKSLQKAGTSLPPLDRIHLDEASSDVLRIIRNASDRAPRNLTVEEAVHGVEGDPYIGSLKVGSSPGFPYSLEREKGLRGKATWIGHADELSEPFISDKLLSDVDQILESALEGKRSNVYWLDFPKDETRPIEKVESLKTRSVNCSPLAFTVACRVAFGQFCAAQMDGRGVNGSAIGINPYSDEWDKMARHLLRVGDNCIAGDYGNWDGGISTDLLWAAFDVIDGWYGNDGYSVLRRTLFEDIASSTHVFSSFIYIWQHSMPSGTYLTACVNTLINNIIVRLAWMDTFRGTGLYTLSSFNQNCRTVALGDDHVITVSRPISKLFNQTHLQVFAESLGMTYTDEKKTDRRDITVRPIAEVEFLKRGFVQDSEYRRFLSPLSLTSIHEMFNWLRKGLPTEVALQLNMECAFRELSQYPRQIYDEALAKVTAAFRSRGYNVPPTPCWRMQRVRVLTQDMWLFDSLNSYD